MRSRISIFLAVLISGSTLCFSQSSEREINKEFYKADAQLSIVINYLPKGWIFTVFQDTFIINGKDSVWVLEENYNASIAESKESRIARIQKSGTRILPQVIIRYEEKWSPEKVQLGKIHNAAINEEIRNLPEKYHIQHLRDTLKSSKNNIVYTATNDKETKLLEQFENKQKQLISQKVLLPDFHSEKYSLFIVKTLGRTDSNHQVYPIDISLQVSQVVNTFGEICGK